MGDAIELFTNSAIRFNGLTLLAYLNYTPRLRYTHEDQIHYSRTRCMARVPSRKSYANSPSTLAVSGRREKSRRTQRVRTTPTHSPPPWSCALHACMHGAKYRAGPPRQYRAAAPPTPYPAARGRAHRLPQRATTCDLPRCAKDVATPRSCHRHHFALAGPRRNRPTRFRHSCSAARDWARRVSPSAATFLLLGRVIRASAPRAGPRACVCVS